MAELHILRAHSLGLAQARDRAEAWTRQAEKEFGLRCTLVRGECADDTRFERSGVAGNLRVTQDHFELRVRLGFLLGAYQARIEAEIGKNLDTLLSTPP